MNCKKQNHNKHSYVKRNFTNKSINEFIKCLNKKVWNIIYHCDIQTVFTRFQKIFNLNLNKCFPFKIFTINYKNRHPWMTANLRSQIMKKNKLHLKSHIQKNDIDLNTELKQKRNQLTSDLRNAEILYYSRQLELNKSDIAQSWRILKTIIGKGINKTSHKISFCINGNTVTESKIIASEFNRFFTTIGSKLSNTISCNVSPMSYIDITEHSIYIPPPTTTEIKQIIVSLKNRSPGWDEIPAFLLKTCSNYYVKPLTYIINKTIEEGIFPNELKLARVVPIFKTGDPSSISNYRPISVLSFFPKIFERYMYNHVVEFMNINNIIYKYQFGFRQRHSTQQAIITLVNKITSSIDSGDLMIGVFLDLKKAFDTVTHSILIRKMHAYGIRGNILKWFESYLADRSQYVAYDGSNSDTSFLECGVPQGSILGPLLFIIFTNDIFNVSELLFTVLYADDTCVLLGGKDLENLITCLNNELKKITTWLKANKLSLNAQKNFYMIFHRARLKLPHNHQSLHMNDSTLSETQQFKYLGVLLDQKVSWIQTFLM